jgi:hypothetical protein
MHVNTSVVKALMHLRGIDEFTLANLVHVAMPDMRAWLYDLGEDSDDRVDIDTQMEVLRVLGINGESPRGDIVHYWRIHEPFFSRAATTYWALAVALKAFGKAQAVFIAAESDPALEFSAKARFGLRFAGFYAILEVTAHPLRSISFDPDNMTDLTWVPDTMGVLLPEAEYRALEPGAMKVRNLQQYLTYNAEAAQWERLRNAALEKGIRADQVAGMLMGLSVNPNVEAISHEQASVAAEPAVKPAPVEPEPVVAPVAAAPQPAATPTPAPVATPAPAASQEADEMRLFVTPVRTLDSARGKRVA